MNALLAMTAEDGPRLYSKPVRAPLDVVAEQHQLIHVELEAYGLWCRRRYEPKTCESIEGRFDPGEGGRKTKAPLVALPDNPRHRQIDRVIRYMRMHLNRHGEAILMYYVGVKNPRRVVEERCSPRTICRALHMRWEDFDALMFDARAAVLNLLRRNGN